MPVCASDPPGFGPGVPVPGGVVVGPLLGEVDPLGDGEPVSGGVEAEVEVDGLGDELSEVDSDGLGDEVCEVDSDGLGDGELEFMFEHDGLGDGVIEVDVDGLGLGIPGWW